MKFSQRGIVLISVALAGLAPSAASLASTSPAAPGHNVTRTASQCIQVTATIPLGRASGGIAVNPKTDTIYVASGQDKMHLISGQTDTVTGTIPLGVAGVPSGIAADPATNTVFVANAPGDGVAVISGQTDTVTGTIPVGDMSGAAAVNPRTNIIYVANQDVLSTGFGSVSVLNGRTSKALTTIPVGVGPTGVTVDPNTNTAYVANAATNGSPNSVSVLAPCQP